MVVNDKRFDAFTAKPFISLNFRPNCGPAINGACISRRYKVSYLLINKQLPLIYWVIGVNALQSYFFILLDAKKRAYFLRYTVIGESITFAKIATLLCWKAGYYLYNPEIS